MISVAEAQALCLADIAALPPEPVALRDAAGRVLARPAHAARAQPPFDASAMDGYAVSAGAAKPGTRLIVVGEAAAGHQWPGSLAPGQALRIFTGAPVPAGAGWVVIQEDVSRSGDTITLADTLSKGPNIRTAGADFAAGFTLTAPRRLGPAELALLAAMNVATVPCHRRPTVALIATGDELVMPGGTPRPDQIIASNVYALSAMIDSAGGQSRILPIAADTVDALRQSFALADGADMIITIGGASVGDHDLVAGVAADLGLDRSFYKIAMRPGKPLMHGRFGTRPFLGLPGNPVSAIVCGHLFLLPMLRRLQGLGDVLPQPLSARLAAPVDANGPRAHYMRARIDDGADGRHVTAFDRQDSALLTVLSQANGLLIRPPGDPARPSGHPAQVLAT